MKCVHCGFFPLSPTRRACPRCGKPVQVSTSGIGRQSVDIQSQQVLNNNTPQVGVEVHEQNGAWNASQASAFRQQTPTPQAAFPPVVFQGRNTDDHGHERVYLSAQSLLEPGEYSPQFAQGRGDTRQQSPLPFGFTLSAVCVITGALILLFVYFMSLGIRTDSISATTSVATSAKTTFVQTTPSPTAIAVTPTPTYPGQNFADNVVMASTISVVTAQPVTATTTFKLKQKIYVTFDVHTNEHTGGICLLWYFNNKPFTTFAFAVSSSSSAYSYTYASVTGTGYVEIYWSDSASCSDPNKLLAQHATFTVTE